jgi:hypothetical protein
MIDSGIQGEPVWLKKNLKSALTYLAYALPRLEKSTAASFVARRDRQKQKLGAIADTRLARRRARFQAQDTERWRT